MPSGIYPRKPFTAEHRKNLSLSQKGKKRKPHSEETRRKITLSNTKNLHKRFWSKVNIKSFFDCWEWKDHPHGDGYGEIKISHKMLKAHRVMWALVFGDIPNKLYVCHKCDNPICVNPYHLFLGSQKDNMRDMINKGRKARSEINFNARLNKEQVLEIRILYKKGLSSYKIAKLYGVTATTIMNIIHRKTWKNISD